MNIPGSFVILVDQTQPITDQECYQTAQDTKALALCGLVLCGELTHLDAAVETFRAARRITRAPGTVRRLLRLFDILSDAGQPGQLAEARKAAEGTY